MISELERMLCILPQICLSARQFGGFFKFDIMLCCCESVNLSSKSIKFAAVKTNFGLSFCRAGFAPSRGANLNLQNLG
jgi:hypothetical protein